MVLDSFKNGFNTSRSKTKSEGLPKIDFELKPLKYVLKLTQNTVRIASKGKNEHERIIISGFFPCLFAFNL